MRYYFSDTARVDQLQSALMDRLGTPFRIGMGRIGDGYDCWHLLLDVYEVCGLPTAHLRGEKGSLNYGRLHGESKILLVLMSDPVCRERLQRRDFQDGVMPGDILPFRQQTSCNHLLIAWDSDLAVHVPRGGRVNTVSIAAILESGRITSIYRPLT